MKYILFKSKLLAAAFVVATLFAAIPAHASVYTYSGNGSNYNVMQDYTATWNGSSEVLSLSSTWDNPAGMEIDIISFLITDGGSPFNANTRYTEQFLFYTLDLAANTVLVEEYFGRADIGTYSTNLNYDGSSFSLDFDNSMLGLHADSFASQGRTYQSDLFGDTIGIWHYLSSNGSLKDTYDIHYGQTVTVPEPTSMALLGLGLLGMIGRKKLIK